MFIIDPPATAGGTDFLQVPLMTFEGLLTRRFELLNYIPGSSAEGP